MAEQNHGYATYGPRGGSAVARAAPESPSKGEPQQVARTTHGAVACPRHGNTWNSGEPAVINGKRSKQLHYQRPRPATSLVDRGDEQRYLAYHLEPSLPLRGEAPPDDAVLAHFTGPVAGPYAPAPPRFAH